MESAVHIERRCFPRLPFHSKAVFSIDGVSQEGTLIDLSLSGALFRAEGEVFAVLDDYCQLDILHGAGLCCVRTRGRVAYVQDGLIGLQFKQHEFAVLKELMKIVEMNLGTPDMMQRELGALLKAPAGRLR